MRFVALFLIAALVVSAADARTRRRPLPPPPPPPASAAEPDDEVLSIRPSADGESLIVKGWLDIGSFIKFRRILEANPRVTEVRLSSAGGFVQEGVLIGAAIREKGLSTRVETLCASACAIAFVAGKDRRAAPEAWIGFHRAVAAPAEGARELDANTLQRAALRRAEIAPGLIETALSVPADSIWFPSHAALQQAGVLTRPAGPEHQGGDIAAIRATMAADMRRLPLWKAVEQGAAQAWAEAFALAWRLRTAGTDDRAAMAEAEEALIRTLLPRIASDPDVAAFLDIAAAAPAERCGSSGWAQTASDIDGARTVWLIAMLGRERNATPIDVKTARERLRKPIERTARGFPPLRRTSDPSLRCQAGLALLQRIARMGDEKKRQTFAALVTLDAAGELPGFAIPL